jgi:hypothetical protein
VLGRQNSHAFFFVASVTCLVALPWRLLGGPSSDACRYPSYLWSPATFFERATSQVFCLPQSCSEEVAACQQWKVTTFKHQGRPGCSCIFQLKVQIKSGSAKLLQHLYAVVLG